VAPTLAVKDHAATPVGDLAVDQPGGGRRLAGVAAADDHRVRTQRGHQHRVSPPVAAENDLRGVANGDGAAPRERAARQASRSQRAAGASLGAPAMQAIAAVKPRADRGRDDARQWKPPLPQAGHDGGGADMPVLHVVRYGNDCGQCVPGREDEREGQRNGGGQRPREAQSSTTQRVGQRSSSDQGRCDDRGRDGGERERQQLTDGAQRGVLLGRAMIGHASPADGGCGVAPAGKGWMPA